MRLSTINKIVMYLAQMIPFIGMSVATQQDFYCERIVLDDFPVIYIVWQIVSSCVTLIIAIVHYNV